MYCFGLFLIVNPVGNLTLNNTTKISKTIALLHKAKELVNPDSLYILYCSLIASYLTDGGGRIGKYIQMHITNSYIFLSQKEVIWIVCRANDCNCTAPLFILLNTLKIHELRGFNIMQIMYKIKNHQLSPGVQDLFQLRTTNYELRGIFLFQKPEIRTNVKEKTK